MDRRIQQRDREQLSSGYTVGHRVYEVGGVLAGITGIAWLAVRVVRSPSSSGWFVPLALFVGLLLADFLSGFIHWGCDSWGSPDMPILGPLAIRTFREHHVDQESITRHDFVETNGHNFALSLLVSGSGLAFVDLKTLGSWFLGMTLLSGACCVTITSQVHKWAHMKKPPRVIAGLQRARLILSRRHHAVHHSAPFSRNYCITAGWLNGPLRAIRFFETLERLITALTGAVPREDDIGKGAALAEAAQALATLKAPLEAKLLLPKNL